MKEVKLKACKNCGTKFSPFKTTDKVCSWECANMLAAEKGKKKAKPKKTIRQVSKKREGELVIYRKKRDEYMRSNIICEVDKCLRNSKDLHHKNGRTGKKVYDDSKFMAVCRPCHTWIHEHPEEAREKSYLI